MNTRKLSAGDIIESRCTRCRKILNHMIVAMVGEKVVRVECNTCRGIHNYHAPSIPKIVKTPRSAPGGTTRETAVVPRASKKDPAEIDREEWALLQPMFDRDRALQYDMNGRYQVRHLIIHPVFGLGVVKMVIVPHKMRVLFNDGIKLLRCQ